MPDTVSLLVADAPCAYFTAGLRYVVAAAPDSVQAGRLRTGDCDEALRVGEMRGNALLDTLGAPNWRAPPLEEREIARRAVPLGTRLERKPFPGAVYFGPTLWDSVASVSIGDLRIFRSDPGTMRVPVAAYLEPGRLYRYRVTWSSGRVYESVLVGRCSALSAAAEHCVQTVLFSLLAPAP
ncbi:MAG TPA: hypothetical protein PLY94_07215 [Gemmatimonadaceae bacterium]|nr:hypothetical protein [Gemmatimonadaceae bacterium]